MRTKALLLSVVLAGAAAIVATATTAQAATGCRVDYTVTSSWQGGFGASVNVTNLGDPVNGWRLSWSFTAGQTVTQLWNGTVSQSGAQVTVANAGYNGTITTGRTAAFGFNGSWTGVVMVAMTLPMAPPLSGVTRNDRADRPHSSLRPP